MAMWTADDNIMRPIIAAKLYEILAGRYSQPGRFLVGTGLFASSFAQSAAPIAPSQLFALVDGVARNGERDLAGHLGQRLLYCEEPLARALLCAPSLATGLRWLSAYHRLWQPQVFVRTCQSGGFFHIDLHCWLARADLARFFLLASSSFLHAWLRELLGVQAQWQLPLSANQLCAAGVEFLGPEVQWRRPLWRLSVPMALLHAPVPEAETEADAEPWLHQCAQQLARVPAGPYFLRSLVRALRRQPDLSQQALAAQFDLSPATLKRRLRREHTHFQHLQDALRGQQALHLIVDRGWTNQRLADFFSISDVNNFRRAFKRWTGARPSELR